mmetsp:Transcript_12543/g.36662  ORF Transcript_12543/g.36662 Transcript_12543/m.36662 type:complete len:140 (-) Transcript_12543:59-478(-)
MCARLAGRACVGEPTAHARLLSAHAAHSVHCWSSGLRWAGQSHSRFDAGSEAAALALMARHRRRGRAVIMPPCARSRRRGGSAFEHPTGAAGQLRQVAACRSRLATYWHVALASTRPWDACWVPLHAPSPFSTTCAETT